MRGYVAHNGKPGSSFDAVYTDVRLYRDICSGSTSSSSLLHLPIRGLYRSQPLDGGRLIDGDDDVDDDADAYDP